MTRIDWVRHDPELRRRYAAGESFTAIAGAIGVARGSVAARVRKLELPSRGPVERNTRKGETRGVTGLPPDTDQRKMRTCLYCREAFMSSHPGNRRCERCKPIVDHASGGIDAVYY